MGTRFKAPKGALRSNLGLLAGTVIRELRMHPFWDDDLEGVPWNFRPEWLEFTVLSIVTGGYLCRYSGAEDTFAWPFWEKQPNYGYMKDGCTPVCYYVKEMPPPPPYESKPGFSPFDLRCMEIDEAALLIRDPDAFAAAAAEPEMAKWNAGTCLEWPSTEFLDGGGCPFYRGKHLLEQHNYQQFAALGRELREVRQRRRKAKDTLGVTEPVLRWLEENRAVVKSIERLLGDVRKIKNRIYVLRINRRISHEE